ncbi:hypothetical protein ABXT63_03465 [Candidatus Pelagibacter sp. Uisw_092]|uniref:hypothetical protein n=1 Tax=Candidatus Pelagibacter sp. Uisw_092 TaxID=3230979 RepID=UPI0039EA5478
MKKLFIIIIIFISFQALSKADDIKDFEIEGISIGDSLLAHYSKKELNNSLETYHYPGGNDFVYYFLNSKNAITYNFIQAHVNPKDKNYVIAGVEGHIFYDKISDCYKEMTIIKQNVEDTIDIDATNDSGKHPTDKSGKSTYKRFTFFFKNNDYVEIVCYDMSKEFEEKGKKDRLIVSLSTKKLYDFLTYKAYK